MPDTIRGMTPADSLAATRAALWGTGAVLSSTRAALWSWVAGIGSLADQLLELLTVRDAERAALTEALPPRGAPLDVEDAKFHLGGDHATIPPERASDELPRTYGRDRVVLLPRDPWTLFAYWEVTPGTRVATLRALGSEAGGAREVLRVYDVTFVTPTGDHAWLAFDVEPLPGTTRLHASASRPGASYIVEIGLRTTTNRFLPMARSNTVTLPPAAPSPDTTVRWTATHMHPPIAAASPR